MGRTRIPPHGNPTSNIVGKYLLSSSISVDDPIQSGDFVRIENIISGSINVVSKSNNRFNSDGIAIENQTIGGQYVDIMIVDDHDKDKLKRLTEQTSVTKAVGNQYIAAGEFVHINADNSVTRANGFTHIDGYALDSGIFGANIRIITL